MEGVVRTPLPAERIAELLQLCLKSTYFSYNSEFYEQRQGAAMGSPVSAVVANLYMEFFEELALESAPSRPRFWKQYVDDTCCIMRRGEVEPLLHHLNDMRPTIKITMELEKDGMALTGPGTSHDKRFCRRGAPYRYFQTK